MKYKNMRQLVITMGEGARNTFNRVMKEEIEKELIKFKKLRICRYCKAEVSGNDDSLCYAKPDKEYYRFDNRGEIISRLKGVLRKNNKNSYVRNFKW